ncbi:tetratricopeptide repeat protein [Hahella sp. NBU794]|uniref:tetratricopeptide repeat protein n=1 Tax=Hahella sp. NBU794 TaxID=3422590 RepID=UPI003D6EC795
MTNIKENELLDKAEEAYEKGKSGLAVKIYTRLYEQGYESACQELGFIFKYGGGDIEKDETKSQYWYQEYLRLLSEKSLRGNLTASLKLGLLYLHGDNVKKDNKKATKLIRKAAENHLPEAEFQLACMFLHGWGGNKVDIPLYQKWLDLAVQSEHLEAMYTKALDCGDLSLMEKAARGGFWPAQSYIDKLG